jgi:hypothetical protein
MAKDRQLSAVEFQTRWQALAEADRQFISILGAVTNAIDGEPPQYLEPPARLERVLRRASRETLFGVLAECLYRLLDAPVMKRLKRLRQRRSRAAARQATGNGKAKRPGRQSRAK